jgi:hypothetical protein
MNKLASFWKYSKHWLVGTLEDDTSLALPPFSLNDRKPAPIVHLTRVKVHGNQAIFS